MNLKSLFTVALAALVLTSCTKEVIKYVDGGEENENGTARVKFALTYNDAPTRAGHSSTKPTNDELQIYNYALFIFKASGMLEASLIATPYKADNQNGVFTYNDTDMLTFKKSDNPNNPYIDDDDTITLSTGTKLFFAIVNAPAHLLAIQDQYLNDNTLTYLTASEQTLDITDLSTIVGSYDSRENNGNGIVYFDNTNTDNRGFMMTTINTRGYEERVLEETEEDDDPEVVTLSVGRAMAKVSLGTELPTTPDPDLSPNGVLDVQAYKIINNPKEMNIMLKYQSGVLVSPYYYDNHVDSDKYFISENEVDTSDPLEPYYMPVSKNTERTFTYCIENANNRPKQGNSTMAIIKGKFTPGGNATIWDNPEEKTVKTMGDATDGTFYRIWIPAYGAGNNAGGNRYDGVYYIDEPTTQQLEDYATAEGWPVTLLVDKYEKGICYYRLPLYNNNSNAELAPYTVKRNTYYMIDIESVMDAGYTDEDKGGGGEPVDPEEPLEAQSEIKVSIKVEDWEEVKQGGNL